MGLFALPGLGPLATVEHPAWSRRLVIAGSFIFFWLLFSVVPLTGVWLILRPLIGA